MNAALSHPDGVLLAGVWESGCVKIVPSLKVLKTIVGRAWEGTLREHCMDARYYEVVAETLAEQFDYRFAVIATGERLTVQPFFLVDQDLLAGLPVHLRGWLDGVRRWFPRFLKVKVLMVGCAAGEGELAIQGEDELRLLREAVEAYGKEQGVALVLFKDVPARYRKMLQPLVAMGYQRLSSMPGARLRLDFENFEEYIRQRLGRVYRKGLRRKFRESERRARLVMEQVDDLRPYIDEVYPLYRQTYERSQMRFECLTPEYFCRLGERMGDRVRFFTWRLVNGEGAPRRLVAFSACMVHDGRLYDLNVGMDYEVAYRLHLYFVTWRDLVVWARTNGLNEYYTGPLNYDPKLHLKMELAPLDLYARHVSPWLNGVTGLALKWLEPVRYDATLKRFPNAAEL